MTRRPADIADRMANVRQIEDVVVALRGMAAAHARDARRHLTAIREHAATAARAMSSALSAAPHLAVSAARPEAGQDHLLIVIGAAQGFVGLYNEHIAAAAIDQAGGVGANRFLLIGHRCITEFEHQGIKPVWSANMVAHSAEVTILASRIADTLYEGISRGTFQRVSLIYGSSASGPLKVVVRHLLPFDFRGIGLKPDRTPKLMTLPPEVLLERLVEEYVFAEICEALMLAFAAENVARMQAMTRARSNVDKIAEDLQREYHVALQEKTTTEIFELSIGSRKSVR